MAPRTRKNHVKLTSDERKRFAAAVKKMMDEGRYDWYVQTHIDSMWMLLAGGAMTMWAHMRPAFLQRLLGRDPSGADSLPTQEQWDAARALTTYDAPLWDSNVDSPAPRPPAQHPPPNPVRFAGLTSFRNVFEGWVPYYDTATAPYVYPNLHNRVHAWVSGLMAPFSSPNDPVFFLHHCNVDRLWAEWQRANPTWKYKPDDGEPSPNDPDGENIFPMGQSGAEKIDLRGHHLHDSMPPWDGRNDPEQGGTMPKVSPASVLNHVIGIPNNTKHPYSRRQDKGGLDDRASANS